jgi:hypothetical protein
LQYIVIWRTEGGEQGYLFCGNKAAAEAKFAELYADDKMTYRTIYRVSSKPVIITSRTRTVTSFVIED